MKTSSIYDDVIKKYQNRNQILFSKNSMSLHPLIKLICEQNRQILILWSFDRVKEIVLSLDDFIANDIRITEGIKVVHEWSKGNAKMPVAKKSILEIHAIAKEINNRVMRAKIHAIGQGLSTVHVKTHALGLIYYELTSIVLKNGIDCFEKEVSQKISYYVETLTNVKKENHQNERQWAKFLRDK